jgi:hypothetical protein
MEREKEREKSGRARRGREIKVRVCGRQESDREKREEKERQ